jgi:hypothetical protein
MDITMIGLQNAGKTSLLRVLAVSVCRFGTIPVQHRGISIDGIVLTDSIRAASSPSSTFVSLHATQAFRSSFCSLIRRLRHTRLLST